MAQKKWVWGSLSLTSVVLVLGIVYAFGPEGFGFGGSGGSGATMEVETKIVDLGKVAQWRKQVIQFPFKNTGYKDLLINPEIFCSSQRARATLSSETIPPGGDGNVEVVFEPGDLEGQHKIFCVLRTNDVDQATVTLTAYVELESKFWVDPPSVMLGALSAGEKIEDRIVKLRWQKSRRVVLKKVVPDNDAVTVTQEPFEDEDSAGVDLRLAFEPFVIETEADFQKTFRAKVQVHTSMDAKRIVMVPITGNFQRPVSVNPRILKLGAVTVGDKFKDVLEVKAADGQTFDVLSVECDASFIKTRLEEVEPRTHYRIHLSIEAMEVLGEVNGIISIETNAKWAEKIACRVVGVINP